MYCLLLSPSTEKYFKKENVQDLVIEYEFLKKLMYVGVPLLIIILIVFLRSSQEKPNFSFALFPGLTLIVSGGLLRILSNITKKDFRFYYARGCFQIYQKKTDEAEKMYYFMRALNSYNKYLKRNLKLQISNINNIYSKIISDSILEKHEFIKSMSNAFQSDNKLKPTKYILNFLNIQNTEQFLTKEPLWDKIKEWGVFLAAVIPVVISIVQLLFNI